MNVVNVRSMVGVDVANSTSTQTAAIFLDGLGVSILDPPEMAGNMPEIYRNFNLIIFDYLDSYRYFRPMLTHGIGPLIWRSRSGNPAGRVVLSPMIKFPYYIFIYHVFTTALMHCKWTAIKRSDMFGGPKATTVTLMARFFRERNPLKE